MVPDMSAVAAMVSSINAATQITKAMLGLRDHAMIQSKVIELNTEILAAQSSAFAANTAQTALLEQIRDLEKKIAKLEAWETEKQRYKLTELAPGVTAYVLKPEMVGGEPPHHICGSCYQHSHKSVLQREFWEANRADVLVCHDCGSVLYVKGLAHISHKQLKPEPYRGS